LNAARKPKSAFLRSPRRTATSATARRRWTRCAPWSRRWKATWRR
jgi:hypothetical protein